MRTNREPDLKEFRFHYHFDDSVECSDKYFMARNYDEAKEMFKYACCKRHLHPHLDKVEKWNQAALSSKAALQSRIELWTAVMAEFEAKHSVLETAL